MILSWLKTYALQAALIALGTVTLFAGVQTWRLVALQDRLDEQREQIIELMAAIKVNEASIEALRKANAAWAEKCKAEPEKLKAVIEGLKKQAQLDKDNLKKARDERKVIYVENNDSCPYVPVPLGIIERLRK